MTNRTAFKSDLFTSIRKLQASCQPPQRYMTIIPDGVSDYVAGPIMSSASTVYFSIKESKFRLGQWALFPGGGGGVGIHSVQLAAAMGLRLVVVDTGEEKKLSAEEFIDFKEVSDVPAEVVKVTNGIGAHGVFVTVPQSYDRALAYLGTRCGGQMSESNDTPPVCISWISSTGHVQRASECRNTQREHIHSERQVLLNLHR